MKKQPRPPSGWVLTSISLVLLACTVGGLLPGAPQTGGPILEMLSAAAVDKTGQPTDPKFSFDPSAPQIAVVAWLDPAASLAAAPLTLTWYQETFDGDQQLFSDSLKVNAGEVAFSTGTNPGTLAAGMYKVTARLGNQSRDTYFAVAQPQAQSQTAPAAAGPAAGGRPPLKGAGGTVPASSAAPSPTSPNLPANGKAAFDACTLFVMQTTGPNEMDYDSDTVGTEVMLIDCDAADIQLNAAVNGPPEPFKTFHLPAPDAARGSGRAYVSQSFELDPCALPGHSDLPGDHVLVSATLLSGMAKGLTKQYDRRLGPDTIPPVLHVTSDPPRSTHIRPDSNITLTISAEDPQPGGPWQTGVQKITVDAFPGGHVDESSFGKAPAACGAKVKKVNPYKVVYAVPEKPPAQFDLCVVANDFGSDPGNRLCGTYYTGAHWTGTINTTAGADYGTHGICKDEKWKSKLEISVADDGSVSGSDDAQLVAAAKCSGDVAKLHALGAATVHMDVSGRFDGKKFMLKFNETGHDFGLGLLYYIFTGGDFSVTGQGSAGGIVSDSKPMPGGYTVTAQHIFDLTCTNCR